MSRLGSVGIVPRVAAASIALALALAAIFAILLVTVGSLRDGVIAQDDADQLADVRVVIGDQHEWAQPRR